MREVKIIDSLQNDYQYCENVIKHNSASFYHAFKNLPKDKANAVYAIYAFCRYADDSVDETGNKSVQEKNWQNLYHQLKLFEKGEEISSPLWRALRDVFTRYEMDIKPFYEQLEGQKMDINFQQPNTLAELEQYCYYVAGTVGLMLLPILATENHQHLHMYAVQLGVAMQLTNILRDVGEDYRNNRIYLPVDLLEKEDYKQRDLEASNINASFIKVWEEIATRSEQLYALFQEGIDYFDKDSQLHVLLSALIYKEILKVVRENGYDCLHTRNYVSEENMLRLKEAVEGLTVGL